ncbi:MAG: glycosyltransferase [Erysipelotrichaceae bacterium]
MRIGIFTDTYLPDINGVVTSIVTLQHALEKEGHEVFVITNHKALISMEREGNILRMPGVELKWLYGYILSTPFHFKAKEEVRRMHLDVIHVHTEFGVGMFGRLVGKSLGIPIVTTYHTMYEDYTHYLNFFDSQEVEKITKKVATSFSKYFSENAHALIAPSEKTKDTLTKYGVTTPMWVIPTGLNLERFAQEAIDGNVMNDIRTMYNIQPSDYVVSYIGRIAPEKSIKDVMEGFAIAKKVVNHLKLLIVGNGPQLKELQDYAKTLEISDCTIFTDKVENTKIPYYYHLSNLFVSASMTETQGMTYIEALASGLCVLAKHDEVILHLIKDNENGFVFENTEHMASLIAECAKQTEEEKQQMKENARGSVVAYDSKTFANQVLEVYESAVQHFVGEYNIEKVQIGDDVVKITISNEKEEYNRKLLVTVDHYFHYHIRKGGSINAEVLDVLLQEEIVILAKQMVLKKLKNKDLTRKEVYDLLGTVEDLPIKQINAIVTDFEAKKYIDDHSYVLNYIEKMNRKLKGKHEIIRDLVKKGILFEDAEAAIAALPLSSEEEKARRYALKYMKSMVGKSVNAAKSTLINKLKSQGFDSNVTNEVVNDLDFTEISDSEDVYLLKVLTKAYKSYTKKFRGKELRQRMITFAMGKGFKYDEIKNKIDEMEIPLDERENLE